MGYVLRVCLVVDVIGVLSVSAGRVFRCCTCTACVCGIWANHNVDVMLLALGYQRQAICFAGSAVTLLLLAAHIGILKVKADLLLLQA